MATVGAKNQPIVQNTDTFNPVADINTLSNFFATNYANFKVLTGATTKSSLTGANLFVGLVVWEQSTGMFWQYSGSAWVALGLGSTPVAELTKTASQSLTNNTTTTITGWNTTQARNITVNNTAGTITIPYAGRYAIYAALTYAANGTGARWATIALNGNAYTRLALSAPAAASTAQIVPISASATFAANAVVTINGFQQSGGALDVTAGKVIVEYLGA